MVNAQEYVNENYKNKSIEELNISNQNLEGKLNLNEFTSLTKLNCSKNQLTVLDLSNCLNLTDIDCWDNQLTDLNLTDLPNLKTLNAWTNNLVNLNWDAFNPKTLTILSISNNNFSKQALTAFSEFTNLEELYLGNDIEERLEQGIANRFYGSLKALENLTKLKKLQIEGTKVRENFDYLPNDLQIIGWYKQNDTISKVIPLERLYVIRSNIKQFVNKWGGEDENSLSISKLQSFKETDKSWWTRRGSIHTAQFIGRSSAVVGIVLSFKDYGALGSGILGIYPFAELLISNMEKSREDRKSEWNEFLSDSNTFLDNYNELLGIVSQFKVDGTKKGKVNKTLNNLNGKIEEFLDVYDTNGDREVDINELIKEKNKLFKDLSKNSDNLGVSLTEISTSSNLNNENPVNGNNQGEQPKKEETTLCKTIEAIKNLEKAIISYRKFSYYEELQTNVEISPKQNQ